MDAGEKFHIDLVGDGAYIKVKVMCPNCGKVKRAKKIKSDEPHTEENVKCKCGITGFDWMYTPPRVGDAYVRIGTSASMSAADWPKVVIHNDKRIDLSNR